MLHQLAGLRGGVAPRGAVFGIDCLDPFASGNIDATNRGASARLGSSNLADRVGKMRDPSSPHRVGACIHPCQPCVPAAYSLVCM